MEESAFLEKVSELNKAEKQKQKMLQEANAKAGQKIKEAQIRAQKIEEKALQEAVRVQNEFLEASAIEAQEEEKRILKNAQGKAAKVKEKTISKAAAKKIAQQIIR